MCKSILKNTAYIILATILSFMFFMYNSAAVNGVYCGLLLCAHTVIPSLFPFMVISTLLIENEYSYICGSVFYPYARLLKIESKQAGCLILLSLLGGFAVAASLISSQYERHIITKRDADVLLCCCVGSSPAFVISAVGANILNSINVGIMLFAALTLASLVCGIATSLFIKSDINSVKFASKSSNFSGLVGAIKSNVYAVLSICGYVVFFSFIISIITAVKILHPYIGAIAVLLEPTNACRILHTPYLCCIALSLCGASIIMQIKSILNSDISLIPFLISRIIHIPLSLLFFKLLMTVFPQYISTAAITVFPRKTYMHMPADATVVLFILLCIVFTRMPSNTLRESKSSV